MSIEITSFNAYKLNRFEDENILKIVLDFLDVKDVFKLRDKFEGQMFYDKIRMKLGAKIACDNFFSVKNVIKPSQLRNFNPSILINTKRYFINTFNFDKSPVIDKDKIELDTIFVLYRYPNSFNIIGFCNGDKLKSICNLQDNNSHIRPKFELSDLTKLNDVSDLL